MRTYAIVLAIVALAGGCAPNTPKPPIEQGWRPDEVNADYGSYPSNYQQIIKAWYLENLKDPDSAKFNAFSKPRREHAITNQFNREAVFGYSVCATVNAKNSYGGYTGGQVRWFLIRNGSIVRTQATEGIYSNIYIGRPINCADG